MYLYGFIGQKRIHAKPKDEDTLCSKAADQTRKDIYEKEDQLR
jgi:hypothetical protein